MRFQLLGPLEVTAAGEPIPLGGPKQRLVLAHLLTRANEIVSADLLVDEVWGDELPENAAKTLQIHVSRLRKTLAAERLRTTRGGGYELVVRPDELEKLEDTKPEHVELSARAFDRLATKTIGWAAGAST
jgi:DNA-binding SARP family transcriptional activator